ncbi:aliphatic sulfonate ABC transporter substrate-binding protein [Spelaeicoccus albus]|uniref:NitT/TauT family transport system substrate-binding protein n=1 Tax=Spelaeicoccus albus TaxID=1280376 RepID=A0A7Z0A9U1_9MICO|nr:aliphatic sulfonate ABC transporter substrate-binding protein [Spelaeicoccus albus]NYI67072.1 NitT/TauT family transport system substrate-binding protein [Spelaeicoccus albus]
MNTKPSRRSILIGGAAAAVAPLLASCGGDSSSGNSSKKSIKATVGYIADGNGTSTVAVADKLKLWDKHGIDVTIKEFTDGPTQIQALGTGDLQFAYTGPGALWLPMQGKAKIAAIVSLGEADRIIGQKGITSIKDLKGKTVGVPEGTSGDMLLSLALKNAGLSDDDIKKVTMDPPTVISAFQSGKIDGAAIWYPHVATIKKHTPGTVEIAKSADFPDLNFLSTYMTGTDMADENPELLKRFDALAKEANTWKRKNSDKMVSVLKKKLDAPETALREEHKYINVLPTDEIVQKTKDGTIDTWLKTLNKQFKAMGKVQDIADPKDYYLGDEYVKA